MVQDIVHEEHGQFPTRLQVELPLLLLLLLPPILLPLLWSLPLPLLWSLLYYHSPNGQCLIGMLRLQPTLQRLKFLLRHEIALVPIGQSNEWCHEDGDYEPPIELELLLIGDFTKQLIETDVVK